MTSNKRNWAVTLKPKGKEPDHNACALIMGNGQSVPGLQMASKVFTIICDVELGKPHVLPLSGRNSVKNDNGTEGTGEGKKRKAACNELHRGLKQDLNLKRCRLTNGV